MSGDPASGVVKSTCETHDVRNLYVCDSSVLPTSASVDPSLTIMAFAARTAQRLNESWS
jgi:choline dehydrogenase-like flavoprotein